MRVDSEPNHIPDDFENINPSDVAKGAAIIVGFKFIKGAIRGGYEETRDQYKNIKKDIPEEAGLKDRLKTYGLEFEYGQILRSARDESIREVKNFGRFLIGLPEIPPTPKTATLEPTSLIDHAAAKRAAVMNQPLAA
jgi:hypothetical protein